MWRRCQLAAMTLIGTVACTEAVEPEPDLGSIVYEIFTGCVVDPGGPYACQPNQTAATRGDTLIVGHAVVDTLDDTGTLNQVSIRPGCAVNFEILRGNTLVGTLPAAPTCPDSTLAQGVNAPRILNLRLYPWLVPADYTAGTYTLRSVWLVDPRATRSLEITLR
jgi:hypothetical protein